MDFLDGMHGLGLWYLAEVPVKTRVWESRPKMEIPAWSGQGRPPTLLQPKPGEAAAQRVDASAAQIPSAEWQTYVVNEESKGPLAAEFAIICVVAVRDGLPGPDICTVASGLRFATQAADTRRSLVPNSVYSEAESCRLSFASETIPKRACLSMTDCNVVVLLNTEKR